MTVHIAPSTLLMALLSYTTGNGQTRAIPLTSPLILQKEGKNIELNNYLKITTNTKVIKLLLDRFVV
jgi:hypothetical protein